MNRIAFVLLCSFLGACTITLGSGCTPAAWYFMLRGDGKAPPQYPLAKIEGKKSVTVLVMASSGPSVAQNWEFAGLDRDLATALSRKLMEDTAQSKTPLKTIDPAAWDKFKANTPGWKVSHPSAIAKTLGADYVIDVQLAQFKLYDNDTGRHMYQGQARADVTVYRAGNEDVLHQYSHDAKQPVLPSDSCSPAQYKMKFLDQLVLELSARHTPHNTDRRVAPIKP